MRGVLVTGRRVTDRRDLPIAIEQLGTGARIEVVLPTIASLMARSMGGGATRAAIVWTTDGRTKITTAGGATPLPDSMWRIGQLAWSSEFGTDRVLIRSYRGATARWYREATSGTPTVETQTELNVRRMSVDSVTSSGQRCEE